MIKYQQFYGFLIVQIEDVNKYKKHMDVFNNNKLIGIDKNKNNIINNRINK